MLAKYLVPSDYTVALLNEDVSASVVVDSFVNKLTD